MKQKSNNFNFNKMYVETIRKTTYQINLMKKLKQNKKSYRKNINGLD